MMDSKRFFSTTTSTCKIFKHIMKRRVKKIKQPQVGDHIAMLNRPIPEYPPYPYGEATLYKQSDRGLYGGKIIQFGNKVSDHKNRNVRTFKPNVNWHKLWSEAFNKLLSIKVAGSVLKTITKEGGIDNYLIKDKPARIKELGVKGWRLRYDVLKRLEAQKKEKTSSAIDHMMIGNEEVPIYAKYIKATGERFDITVDRDGLLEILYGLIEKDQGEAWDLFRSENTELGVNGILRQLEEKNYDFEKLTVRPAVVDEDD